MLKLCEIIILINLDYPQPLPPPLEPPEDLELPDDLEPPELLVELPLELRAEDDLLLLDDDDALVEDDLLLLDDDEALVEDDLELFLDLIDELVDRLRVDVFGLKVERLPLDVMEELFPLDLIVLFDPRDLTEELFLAYEDDLLDTLFEELRLEILPFLFDKFEPLLPLT